MILYISTILLAMAGLFSYNYFVNPGNYSLLQIIIFVLLQPVIMIA